MTTLNPVSNPWRDDAAVIGLVGIAHASSHFSHLLLPLMFPVFMSTFGLSYSEVGFLMTVFFVVSGIGQASAGFVVDRSGARPVLFGAVFLLATGCMVVSAANSYGGLMLGAALLGFGNCSFHPVDFTILNQKVSASRLGYAFSAHGLTGNLGWALAPVFMVGLSTAFDWRVAYMGAALLFVAIFVLLLWQRALLHADVVSHKQTASGGDSLAFLKIPVVWWCFSFFLLSTMTLAVVQSFAVSILQALHHVSFEEATVTLTAYMLCAAAGMFVGGFVAARWPRHSDKVVASCMAVGALFMALCGSGLFGAELTMAILAATGLAVGVGGPSRDMMIKKATPKGATGRVYGMVYSGLDTGFAISPLIFGVFMDHGWYGATLLGAACVLLLSVVVALGVGRRTVNA
ncbi:MFS transporter [Limnohabitans sp.]|uniref:MFS transporter n=1 Tax=Limnohabitans sp. TaxID=1907725 RepID=UPI00286EEE0E|nr:MFS transporter [Limnohabitans sp.]